MNSFNKTEADVFSCRLCFLKAFPFTSFPICAGKEIHAAYDAIYEDFRRHFPGHILEPYDRQWVFMNAGGWMGSMQLIHASLSEYVLFFGTGINTSGNSGMAFGTLRQFSESTEITELLRLRVW